MRQFLALEIPRPWREVLAERCRAMAAVSRGWRWSRIEAVHLTLRFLGEVDAEQDARARAAWRSAVARHAPFELRLDRAGSFPGRARPRILWAGTLPDRPLQALAAALETTARECGFEPETRAFRSHLTLARVRRGDRPELPRGLSEPFAAAPFDVHEVILFRSVLHPSGPRYTALERYALGVELSAERGAG